MELLPRASPDPCDPRLLTAITQAGRYLPTAPTITDPAVLADKLRDHSVYPLFAKQVAGKYSLSVLSADGFDPDTDEVDRKLNWLP